MKKLMLMLAALALVASCTQPPRCSREGRGGFSKEAWNDTLNFAEGAVRYDPIDGTESIVSHMRDEYDDLQSEWGTEASENTFGMVTTGLKEIADGKCGGTPSQQRTARKILDRWLSKGRPG